MFSRKDVGAANMPSFWDEAGVLVFLMFVLFSPPIKVWTLAASWPSSDSHGMEHACLAGSSLFLGMSTINILKRHACPHA